MYQGQSGHYDMISGLGFTIPPWVARIAGAVVSGKVVSVPTPVGAITFDLSNPDSLAALAKMVSGTKITQAPTLTPAPVRPSFADSIPGGWATILVAGLGALYLIRRH